MKEKRRFQISLESPFCLMRFLMRFLACYERTVLDMHALALLERRRLVIREVTVLAALQTHMHRVGGRAADIFLDRVTRETAADCAQHRHRAAAHAAAELIAHQTADHRTAHSADAGAMAFLTHC